MKARLIIIAFLIVSIRVSCIAQSVFPGLSDNPRWRIAETVVYSPPFPPYFIEYTLEKDTLINGLTYTCVNYSETRTDFYISYRVGYTRTVGEKVYFKEFLSGTEYLIYDFGLTVGESCYCYCSAFFDSTLYTATRIDTVEINGVNRKRIEVSVGFSAPSYWIEGIGSTQNTFFQYKCCVQDELRCLSTNNGTIYLNPKYKVCDSNTQSIVDTSMQWSSMALHPGPDNVFWNTQSSFVKFSKDTVVNELNYLKVWESNDSLASNWKYVGIIREESLRTYFRPKGLSVDCLLYDFSLLEGDTVAIRWLSLEEMYDYMKVTLRDSIEIAGKKRLKLELSEIYSPTKDTWIEGIGSLNGILNSCDERTGKPILLCVQDNGSVIYSNSNYPKCYYSLNSLKVSSENKLVGVNSVYPNPFNETLNIQSREPLKAITIHDVFGKVLLEKRYQGIQYQDVLSVDWFNSGIYLMKIETYNSSSILFKKLIKE